PSPGPHPSAWDPCWPPGQVVWVMSADWVASAIAVELSDSTFSASAALIGAAMFALIKDMAARSGRASPASLSSSSRVSTLYFSSPIGHPLCARGARNGACNAPLGALADVAGLRGLGGRNGVVGQDVERGCQVDGDRDVRVHQRHRCALGKLLAREPVEL